MHGPGMPEAKPSVVIIDDDAEFRDSVVRLLRSVGLDIQQFSSVADFSKAKLSDGPTCLVLDVRMPGRSGLELQREIGCEFSPSRCSKDFGQQGAFDKLSFSRRSLQRRGRLATTASQMWLGHPFPIPACYVTRCT